MLRAAAAALAIRALVRVCSCLPLYVMLAPRFFALSTTGTRFPSILHGIRMFLSLRVSAHVQHFCRRQLHLAAHTESGAGIEECRAVFGIAREGLQIVSITKGLETAVVELL